MTTVDLTTGIQRKKDVITAQNREALGDPGIERVALISGSHDQRTKVFVVMQNRSGFWRDVTGIEFQIWPLKPSKDFPIAGTSGAGHPAWKTKRLNKARRAIKTLMETTEDCDSPVVESALHNLSEFITEYLPLSATTLPRGYRLVSNSDAQRSLELGGELFNPTAGDPLPSLVAISQLRIDLKTAWVADLIKAWPELPSIPRK